MTLKKILLLIALLVISLGFGGCVTDYDTLEPIPTYPDLDVSQFNTTATIEYVPLANALLNKNILEALKTNNYQDVISGSHYKADRSNPVRILVPLDIQSKVLYCKEGYFQEVRIIVMVREPGEIINEELSYPPPRYFQAYSQMQLVGQIPQVEESNRGIEQAVENLFKIREFRSALEPVGKQ